MNSLATHRYLKRNGYRLIRRLGHNGWYVPADEDATVAAADRWEIVRKYYLALPFRMLRNACAPGPAALRGLVGRALACVPSPEA